MLNCQISRNNILLSSNIRLTQCWLENARGLLWRDRLDESRNEGLVLYSCNSIHMFFMKYPIDVFFMRRDGVVQKVARVVRPWRVVYSYSSYYALEVNAGAAWSADICVGDRLILETKISY